MHIKQLISQHRRDFEAIYECEHCGHSYKSTGYDDDNFHQNVIPTFKCPECGKTASEDYQPRSTKYPADFVI